MDQHVTKRRRFSPGEIPQQDTHVAAVNLPRCHLNRMPLELLAEILSYIPSTRDVLALARTSKHFHAVLVNNEPTQFIWRRARARCRPRIPDPTPNFTEASYAAFLFDAKLCEVCHTKIKEMYHSFALRGSLCDKTKCRTIWGAQVLYAVSPVDKTRYPAFLKWIPQFERRTEVFVRRHDWLQAINELRRVEALDDIAVEAYTMEKQRMAEALPAKRELCQQLVRWSAAYENTRKNNMKKNQSTAAEFAKEISCTVSKLLQTPSYSIMHNTKNRCLEAVSRQDREEVKVAVQREIMEIDERDKRRVREHALQQSLKQIKSKWNDIKSAQSSEQHVLPSQHEFKNLSVINRFKLTQPPGRVYSLEDPFIASLLTDNLEQWREAARTALAGVLGYPNWKNLSKRKLHPVDRVTARFRCQRCDEGTTGGGKKACHDGGMSFTDACAHVCSQLQKKKRQSKGKWSAERFVPDKEASNAILQVLSLCNVSDEDVDSLRVVDEIGDRVQCQSCSCVMDIGSVPRHCKRHAECSFALLPPGSGAEPPINHGLTAQLMQTTQQDVRVYRCRHCAHTRALGVVGQAQQNKLFSFNGLRSHVKEKHHIEMIADEDFFLNPEATNIEAASEKLKA